MYKLCVHRYEHGSLVYEDQTLVEDISIYDIEKALSPLDNNDPLNLVVSPSMANRINGILNAIQMADNTDRPLLVERFRIGPREVRIVRQPEIADDVLLFVPVSRWVGSIAANAPGR